MQHALCSPAARCTPTCRSTTSDGNERSSGSEPEHWPAAPHGIANRGASARHPGGRLDLGGELEATGVWNLGQAAESHSLFGSEGGGRREEGGGSGRADTHSRLEAGPEPVLLTD